MFLTKRYRLQVFGQNKNVGNNWEVANIAPVCGKSIKVVPDLHVDHSGGLALVYHSALINFVLAKTACADSHHQYDSNDEE